MSKIAEVLLHVYSWQLLVKIQRQDSINYLYKKPTGNYGGQRSYVHYKRVNVLQTIKHETGAKQNKSNRKTTKKATIRETVEQKLTNP